MKLSTFVNNHSLLKEHDIDYDKMAIEIPYLNTVEITKDILNDLKERHFIYEFVNRTIPILKIQSKLYKGKGFIGFSRKSDEQHIIIVYSNDDDGQQAMKKNNEYLEAMGWFVAKNNTDIEDNTIVLLYERNFSEIDKLKNVKYLYHITNNLHLDKILKIGLAPKYKEKLTNHPGRVYLMYPDKAMNWTYLASQLFNTIADKSRITDYYLLEVDITSLKNKVDFYEDDNFGVRGAVWTNANITPKLIKIVDYAKVAI